MPKLNKVVEIQNVIGLSVGDVVTLSTEDDRQTYVVTSIDGQMARCRILDTRNKNYRPAYRSLIR